MGGSVAIPLSFSLFLITIGVSMSIKPWLTISAIFIIRIIRIQG